MTTLATPGKDTDQTQYAGAKSTRTTRTTHEKVIHRVLWAVLDTDFGK